MTDTERDTGTGISDRLARARAERDAANAQADADLEAKAAAERRAYADDVESELTDKARRTSRPLQPAERQNGQAAPDAQADDAPQPPTREQLRAELAAEDERNRQLGAREIAEVCDRRGLDLVAQAGLTPDGRVVARVELHVRRG